MFQRNVWRLGIVTWRGEMNVRFSEKDREIEIWRRQID